jgi:hypothetical protein
MSCQKRAADLIVTMLGEYVQRNDPTGSCAKKRSSRIGLSASSSGDAPAAGHREAQGRPASQESISRVPSIEQAAVLGVWGPRG